MSAKFKAGDKVVTTSRRVLILVKRNGLGYGGYIWWAVKDLNGKNCGIQREDSVVLESVYLSPLYNALKE